MRLAALHPLRLRWLRALMCLGLAVVAAWTGPRSALASPPTTAIRYVYDADGHLKAVINPASETALYGWDPAGNLTSIGLKSSAKLSIVQLAPVRGAAGETVTISGTGFSTTPSSDTVKFNGTAATVSAATALSLTVKVPTGATSGTVTVQTTTEGPVTSVQTFTVASTLAPKVTSLSTTIASAGTEVTISGSNFETTTVDDVVGVNQTRAEVVSATATAIVFKVPGATGGGHVSVATPQGSASGPVLYIPPDGIATSKVGSTGSVSVGGSATVKLTTAEKVGLEVFEGTQGERVSVEASEVKIGRGGFSVWGPEGSQVTSSEEVFREGEASLNGPVTLPVTGTYTILLEPEHTDTGSLKVSVFSVVNQTGSLTPTVEGASVAVSLSTPGQEGRFSVSGKAGESIALATSSAAFNGPWRLEWLNPEGVVVGSQALGEKGNALFRHLTFATTGTYTAVVNPEGAATGTTTLVGASEVTGTLTPTEAGESKTVKLAVAGQEAELTFSGTEGEVVSLEASEVKIGFAGFGISGPGGALAPEEGVREGETAGYGPVTLPTTGTYTIKVDASSFDTGSLKLTAYVGSHGLFVRPPVKGARAAAPSQPISSPSLDALIAPEMRAFRPAESAVWDPPTRDGANGQRAADDVSSRWTKVAQLDGAYGATAVSGQVLEQDGLPLAGVRVAINGTKLATKTDAAGRFLLSRNVPAGHQVLIIEGETAGKQRYGTYEVGIDVTAQKTLFLPYTIWLTQLDAAGDAHIASPTTQETSLSTPQIPGLEVRLPAGTVITGANGEVVHKLNLSAIPVARPPFPLPAFVSVPQYFTVQPGRAWLSKGAQIIYPNWGHLPPGQRVDFWNYDATSRGWYVYGQGTVTPDGKQVLPDPKVKIWEFTGAMISTSPSPPASAPPPGASAGGGDPVDLHSGLFAYHKTDLVIPDTIPIVIERTYRQSDSNSYSFGIGMANRYDMRLWSSNNYHEADLVLPDGAKIHYVRTSPGEGYAEAEYKSTSSPTAYYDSTIKWNTSERGWDLALTNGLTYEFGEYAPLQAIRDRYGNKLTITHTEGQKGNISQITSPHGRFVTFKYDGSNRITEIKDNGGRTLKYAYNAAGLLEKVTDPAGRITSYEYNAEKQMTAVKDGRGKTYVENEYEAAGRIAKQALGDGGTYKFAYTEKEGRVEATTVTDPRKSERKVTFNTEGYPTSESQALGTSIEQITTYEPEAGTGLLLSMTDPRGRKTAFKYDSNGNLTQKTLLAGTASAQTTEYKYEPGTTELASVTDPLKHTTTYHYGEHGERLSETDHLGHKTSFEYNPAGQLTATTNPLGKTTKLTYEFGDLTAVTDPLGRTHKQFVDALGNVGSTTAPAGERSFYEYNPDKQMTKSTDPLGNVTSYEYDGDGDLTATIDPNKSKTTLTYDPMDRLESEADPLEHTTKGVYDQDGNLIELTDRRAKLAKFSYDALNRLTESRFGVSGETAESTIKYEYDSGNRLSKIIDSATGTYTPEYDELNRLKSLATPNGTISYGYDEDNRRTAMTVPGQEALKYTYDEANRLTELARGSQKLSFTYDEANRLTKTTLVDGVEEKYGYDTANEITSIAYKKGSTTLGELDYAYNPNGAREAVWGSYARTGLPETLTSATYNADNEQTERNSTKLSYDANGNLTSDGTSEYKWNARNQLTEITGGTKATFEYDPFGRRVSKTLAGTTTTVLYDGANAVQETKGSATANLLTGLSTDKTYARTTSAGTESLLTDALGSTIALAGSTGKAETTYTYDPFGNTTHEGTASENPFQYAGRENDGDGFYYNRARYYSPVATRFISQDPLGEAEGPNLYEYSGDSPVNMTDPFGTEYSSSETVPRGECEAQKRLYEGTTEAEPGSCGPAEVPRSVESALCELGSEFVPVPGGAVIRAVGGVLLHGVCEKLLPPEHKKEEGHKGPALR